jgi:hypothetical protein
VLELFINYNGETTLFDIVRFPDWDSLRPEGGDDEKAILQKTGKGEWLIIDIESFDAVSREFAEINVAYSLAILVDSGVIKREDAVAYGIPAMSHKKYFETKNSLGEEFH